METAAGLKLALETQTASLVRGECVDDGELVRLSGELRAVLADLDRRRPAGASLPQDTEDDDEEDED